MYNTHLFYIDLCFIKSKCQNKNPILPGELLDNKKKLSMSCEIGRTGAIFQMVPPILRKNYRYTVSVVFSKAFHTELTLTDSYRYLSACMKAFSLCRLNSLHSPEGSSRCVFPSAPSNLEMWRESTALLSTMIDCGYLI